MNSEEQDDQSAARFRAVQSRLVELERLAPQMEHLLALARQDNITRSDAGDESARSLGLPTISMAKVARTITIKWKMLALIASISFGIGSVGALNGVSSSVMKIVRLIIDELAPREMSSEPVLLPPLEDFSSKDSKRAR